MYIYVYACALVPGGENVHLKVLIPSIAAGAIIGKGGETITEIQKETGATVKMSKNNDFYPGRLLVLVYIMQITSDSELITF